MFSLIISIVAILLVGALALATLYYGADVAQDSRDRAVVAKAIQEGNQIVGAIELYKSDNGGAAPTGTAEDIKNALLTGNYLSTWPDVAWNLESNYVVHQGMTQDQCLSLNQKLGINEVPACNSASYASRTVCCSVTN